jgi:hypothetical protein
MLGATVAFPQENLDLNNQTASATGQTVTFTVSVNNAPNAVDAIGVDITFAPEVLRFDGFTSGSLVQNWNFFHVSTPAAGQIRLAGFTVTDSIAAGTRGDLVFLNFTVLGESATPLSIVAPVDDVATWTLGTGQFDFVANGAPQANAGPDQDLILAPRRTTVTVTLDGSGSGAPDGGTIREFRWTGTPDPDDVERPSVTLGPGTHDFTLLVVDDKGTGSAADGVQIRVFAVGMLTPHQGNVVAGNAVTLATTGRTDIQSILFQGRPAGTTELTDIGTASALPFLLPLDTTRLGNGDFELRAIVILTNGERFSTPLTTVTINNANPNAAHIVENATSKTQAVAADEANTVITSRGVMVIIPAGALPADDRLMITVVDPLQDPGTLPGDVAGLLVDINLASGLTSFLGEITIALSYADNDQDGIVDGMGINETALTLWFFDEVEGAWVQLAEAVVEPQANIIQATVGHLTTFGMFNVTPPAPPLTMALGRQSPAGPLTLSESVSNLPILQMRLETGAEAVSITSVTLTFLEPLGDATLLGELRVRLVNDANGNGQADAGEEVLATRAVTEVVDTLTLPPVLNIPAASEVNVLVTLDIETTSTAAVLPSTTPRTGLAWLMILSPGLGLGLFSGWRRRSPRLFIALVLLGLCCSLTLTSCGDGDKEEFSFTVGLAANGVSGQGAVSGPVSAPAAAMAGPRITISE